MQRLHRIEIEAGFFPEIVQTTDPNEKDPTLLHQLEVIQGGAPRRRGFELRESLAIFAHRDRALRAVGADLVDPKIRTCSIRNRPEKTECYISTRPQRDRSSVRRTKGPLRLREGLLFPDERGS